MKRYFAFFAFTLSLVLLSSCEKKGVRLYEGNYSFKTSGMVTMERKLKEDSDNARLGTLAEGDFPGVDIPDISFPTEGEGVIDVKLSPESGQMNIIKTGEEKLWVTMNIVGGDALRFDATAAGVSLTLEPIVRMMNFRDDSRTFSMKVTVSGTAEKHAGTILFRLQYSGEGETSRYSYQIQSSDVICVAKLNED